MKTESRLQQECYLWLHNSYSNLRGLFFEINNSSENAREGMRHKCMGRIPGAADSCFLIPSGNAVFIEFKTEIGKQSDKQKNWQRIVESAGYRYVIIRTLDEFKTLINDTLKP